MSKRKELYTVGHITNDVMPSPHVSGGVAYTAKAAVNLGYEAHIVTKCPDNSPYITELQDHGIIVHPLPIRNPDFNSKHTTFINTFDSRGRRVQVVPEVQEIISTEDSDHFPLIPKDAEVVIAPVINEVSSELFIRLANNHQVTVTPQGFFRQLNEQNEVKRKKWSETELLSLATLIVLSNEDLTFSHSEELDFELLNTLIEASPLFALTLGDQGSIIYQNFGEEHTRIWPFPLLPNEVKDLSGAGDTFAFSFLAHLKSEHTILNAGVFASLYAALKISDLHSNQAGLKTVPSQKDICHFADMNSQRISNFLVSNSVNSLKLSIS